jgi:hypothetical protein
MGTIGPFLTTRLRTKKFVVNLFVLVFFEPSRWDYLIIPAATVSFVPSSMRTKLPVMRFLL